jgi:hypothetical protein
MPASSPHAKVICLTLTLLLLSASTVWAHEKSEPPRTGKITGRSVVAGAASLLLWPGIGQAINNNKGQKVGSHAVLGLLPPYRFWSAYDALVDRNGGYWKGRI